MADGSYLTPSLQLASDGSYSLGAMNACSVFLKLAGVEDWVLLCRLKVEDQKEGVALAQGKVAEYLLTNKDAVAQEAQLRGMGSGHVLVSWTPSYIQEH